MTATVIPDDYPVVMGTSAAYRRFAANGPVTYYDSLPGSEDALIDRIRDFEVVINIRSSTRFTERVLAACLRVKLLSIWGTGTDNIDLAAAQRHGVTVTNTPAVAAVSIAEHSLMLTLAVARRTVAHHQQVVGGQWPRGQMVHLRGKTLGIIGLGAIGREFARLGEAIGMNVITWTMHPDPQRGFRHVDLDTLLSESDVVSLHLSLSPETCCWRIDRITPRLGFGTTLDSASAIGTNRYLSVIQILQPSGLAGVLSVQHGFDGDYRNFENRIASSRDQPWSRIGSGRGTRAEPFRSAALRKDAKAARTEQS